MVGIQFSYTQFIVQVISQQEDVIIPIVIKVMHQRSEYRRILCFNWQLMNFETLACIFQIDSL